MEKSAKKHYSEEFKQEAIELAAKVGLTRASADLGVHETSIRAWKKKIEMPIEADMSAKNKKSYNDLEKENRRLQKELGYMKEINKVLKKSTAIFSADQMGNIK